MGNQGPSSRKGNLAGRGAGKYCAAEDRPARRWSDRGCRGRIRSRRDKAESTRSLGCCQRTEIKGHFRCG